MLAKYLPRVIRSDGEHDRLAGFPMKLALSEERTAEQERLVGDYDERRLSRRFGLPLVMFLR